MIKCLSIFHLKNTCIYTVLLNVVHLNIFKKIHLKAQYS